MATVIAASPPVMQETLSGPPKAFHAPVLGTTYHGDGREGAYLMNVGKFKGPEVERVMQEKKPSLVLEVGAYVGYSAVEFGRRLHTEGKVTPASPEWNRVSDDQKAAYVSLEYSSEYARVTKGVVELAGLQDAFKIIVGSSTETIPTLRAQLSLAPNTTFDMIFLDHIKHLYLPDLRLLEELGFIGPGTLIVADNVIKPGTPDYLAYVRSSNAEKVDAKRKDPSIGGNPSLVYKSRLFDSYDPYTAEPDGVEFTESVQEQCTFTV
ncbi:S-adenosyl-L-methionine-dependent methyltransferase [Pterulicium gracile]|uniref:catechol O-methyltransferase n=1 Tax=Pterulicium gracile TaxID=1884261 RepID=A0A5C3QZU9_9AGAR|nr:S-adenosyl-L-methionine-dependent methyltransferase [Pterula gracilis]